MFVVAANPYSGKDIIKGECVGHVQKRVGGRRKFKKVIVIFWRIRKGWVVLDV